MVGYDIFSQVLSAQPEYVKSTGPTVLNEKKWEVLILIC